MNPGQDRRRAGILDIALWVDESWLSQAALTRHLVSGLMSEGNQISFLAPESLDLNWLPLLGSRLFRYRDYSWRLLRRRGLQAMVETLLADPPDVLLVHGNAIPHDLEIVAKALDLPIILWCFDGSEFYTPLVCFKQVRHLLAASQPIFDRQPADLRQPVTLLRPGVYAEETVACYDEPEHLPCLVCLDPLSDLSEYKPLLEACRALADEEIGFLLFAYDTGRQEHPIWKMAQALKLLDRISFVPYQEDAESLLLHGDVYLHVNSTTRLHHRTLEAMGRGLAVIARPNPSADYQMDHQTCRLVSQPSAAIWTQVLRELLTDRAAAIEIARRGQQWVHQQHPMSRMIEILLAVFHQVAGTPLPWP